MSDQVGTVFNEYRRREEEPEEFRIQIKLKVTSHKVADVSSNHRL